MNKKDQIISTRLIIIFIFIYFLIINSGEFYLYYNHRLSSEEIVVFKQLIVLIHNSYLFILLMFLSHRMHKKFSTVRNLFIPILMIFYIIVSIVLFIYFNSSLIDAATFKLVSRTMLISCLPVLLIYDIIFKKSNTN